MTIAKIPMLYHFTDRRNLASIRELGGLYSLTKLNEMGVQITAPGGNELESRCGCMQGRRPVRTPMFQKYSPDGVQGSRSRSYS